MKMFGLIGVGERAGSGVPSVIAVWSDVTGMVPTYKQSFAPERMEFTIKMSSLSNTSADNLSIASTIGIVEKSSQKSSQKILELIAVNTTISTQEMADSIGISRRAIAKIIAKLQTEGILRRIGPDKGGHWEIVE